MERSRFIASCSFGKDSMATVLLAKAHGEPLDEAVYCEVMFDKDISGEVPEHRDFIYETAIPALERMGVKVIVLRSLKTYVELFTGRVTRGQRKGMVRSFPLCGKCYVQRDCKVRPIERYRKTLPSNTVPYVGIAQDEQDRLLRLKGGSQISLLEKYKFTEKDAWEFCRKANVIKLREKSPEHCIKRCSRNILWILRKKVLTKQEKCAAAFAKSKSGPLFYKENHWLGQWFRRAYGGEGKGN